MKIRKATWSIFIAVSFICHCCVAEFFTLASVGVSIGAAVGTYFGYCHLLECCTDDYILIDTQQLHRDIESQIYGQPLAKKVVKILNYYKVNRKRGESDKALVISLYGWPGTGKNFLINFIVKAFYKRGHDSSYMKMYIGRNDFPDPSRINEYQSMLKSDIRNIVKKCGNAVFIFDEVNDIPEGVLDILKPFMDHHKTVGGVDYRQTIFIFLSNTNGNEIAQQVLKLNKSRDSLNLSDFEQILRKGSFASSGGFKNAASISSHLIDHYIPFLPLEQRHVEMCVKTEFRNQGKTPLPEEIDQVMSIVTYGPPDNPIFANAGCKRIKKQVALVLGDRPE